MSPVDLSEDALICAAQFMDGVKPDAVKERWWTEWDAQTRQKIANALIAIDHARTRRNTKVKCRVCGVDLAWDESCASVGCPITEADFIKAAQAQRLTTHEERAMTEPLDQRYEPRIGPLEFWSAPLVAILLAAFCFWLAH